MENNKIKLSKSIIGYSFNFILFFIILLMAFIFSEKIRIFSSVFGSQYNFKNVGIVLFYICLAFTFAYYTIMLIRSIVGKRINTEWDQIISKIDKIFDIPLFITKCISIILFIMIFITTPCTVVGDSMYPTFSSGERVLSFNIVNNPKKGDIVVFDAEEYNHDASFYIKRIVAAEGDIVSYDRTSGKFYVNDTYEEGVSAGDFIEIRNSAGIEEDTYTFIIPKNRFIVLGDNRENSMDSRSFGLIHEDSIFGVVYFGLIPFGKI